MLGRLILARHRTGPQRLSTCTVTKLLQGPKLRTSQHTRTSTNSTKTNSKEEKFIQILENNYTCDKWTNVTPRVLSKIGKELHNKKNHPLNLIKLRIVNYFYSAFSNRAGNPLFSVFDRMNQVVTVHQNFDSLLVPKDHVSRSQSDTYYVNAENLLRAHTSAHQEELIKMGFDAFLCVGDVYRRDEIDANHYPVFHQMEGVRLFSEHELFSKVVDPTDLKLFENSIRRPEKQEIHTLEAVKLLEHDLKSTLLGLTKRLFGQNIEYRWVDAYFPFTHPSWELEIMYNGEWLEVLGCGIMEQKLLENAGAQTKIGWAFGLGLDRLAMKLYSITDIRQFWCEDPAFTNQFTVENPETNITFKPYSMYPPCKDDVSFWITEQYTSNDFYDLVRNVGGDFIQEVTLIDQFTHPKTNRISHCYRIVYRHMEKTFTQEEVNEIHFEIGRQASEQLGVEIRTKKMKL